MCPSVNHWTFSCVFVRLFLTLLQPRAVALTKLVFVKNFSVRKKKRSSFLHEALGDDSDFFVHFSEIIIDQSFENCCFYISSQNTKIDTRYNAWLLCKFYTSMYCILISFSAWTNREV